MPVQTPDWVKNAIFYQIFPDRFARSPRTPHPPGLKFKPWGTPPAEQGYQGGDLRGIVDTLDYLTDLGINALYLNPVFMSASNHRYHTFDYYKVDPLLGGDDALRELLDAAHARDMRVMLDGVFNHASRGFWPFHHILENGGNSPYIDWFIIHGWPLAPYAPDAATPINYEAWARMPWTPKLNTANPDVQAYIYDVARYWLDFGIDAWRLDVPFEIDDDAFWRGFRDVVKAANPEAYICGEVWEDARRWLQGDQFDGVMNYIFAWSSMSFFGAETLRPGYEREHYTLKPLDAPGFARVVDYMHGLYDWQINHAQLNLLDSHDTPRAVWVMSDDTSALKLCALYQMTMPGAPCIYYGDEIGMSSDDDPHCREAFPWGQPDSWDHDLLAFYKRAIALRHAHPVLRTGSFQQVYAEDTVFVFSRKLADAEAVVAFNTASEAQTVDLLRPGDASFTQVWPGSGHVSVADGRLALTIPARDALVLIR